MRGIALNYKDYTKICQVVLMECNLLSNKTCLLSEKRNFPLLKQLLIWHAAKPLEIMNINVGIFHGHE